MHIYTFGETLYDITFHNGQPVSAWPGGAMLNTSISLGRLKIPVSLISEFGQDPIGEIIEDFLQKNGISTKHISRFSGHNTTIALAFLNDRNEASYSFYKDYPEKRLQGTLPMLSGHDFFLFGSFFALDPDIRPILHNLLKEAKKQNTFIYYDPNFRKSHLDQLPLLKKNILENISMATLMRGSDEDFLNIFGAGDADEAYRAVSDRIQYLIYTASDRAVYLRTPDISLEITVPYVQTVSTVGAGDTFNAGIAYELFNRKITPLTLAGLNETAWKEIIKTAIRMAGEVCKSYENYISIER
ncbi:MAG: carbohydrate kinase [Bacteroidales bacterium]|nr:carbohydrate kinase [Bacteroidales bacterium]